jgi:hypothetical protein
MNKNSAIALIFFILALNQAQSQKYPALRNVHVTATATFHESDGFYYYGYGFENDVLNSGNINAFEVDISRVPSTVDLDTVGLRFQNDGFSEQSFRRNFPVSKGRIVPVGFAATLFQQGWVGTLSNHRTAVFDDGVTHAVKPGKMLGGFNLMSKGLPTIRSCVFSPYFDVDSLFPSIDDPNRSLSIIQMDSIQEAANFHTLTIGPTAPPLNFDASVWIDTLLSYIRQSVSLGWLGKERDDDCDSDEHPQDGIEKNIQRRLMMAQRDLQRGDSVKARRSLEQLVRKIERLWKRGQEVEQKHEHDRGDRWQHRNDWVVMTSEAYALLKYNTEYLIDRLPERERHGGKEKVK